ncbi:MAG TPA: RecQ family ATP-dependent DNA helicase [Chloroflexi bacterium]|jgi:ATP-dependent DNA helicase RecQ|nr:RecQ family ATP-dependent DNA helicase [Chloroflexota bacterium]HAL29002.1 RecQ family ATP-dependent DNA helicase [Chloroflexota bacterium]
MRQVDPGRRYDGPDEVLKSVFGFTDFRPGQRKIIDTLLAGRDCIALMPTGAGKSLIFQIPAKILSGPVLVISPLISLMKDQVDALVRTGFRAVVLNSTIDRDERKDRLEALRRGELDLIYIAPEALGEGLRDVLARSGLSLLVVDEAHCISQWGHDFRPAYRQLQGLKTQFGDIPILALTATATRRVVADILKQLGMRKPDGYKGSFFRPNLIVTTQKKGQGRNTRADILALIRKHKGGSGIVYCLCRKTVDETAAWLRGQGVKALAYHAGLSDEERIENQNTFARDDCDAIVATVAFGMGIDKSNVRFVIHRDMPRTIEGWYQEMGRAGRDGQTSECVVMYSWADVISYDRFLEQMEDDELRSGTRAKTLALFNLLEGPQCRHQALARYFDEAIERCGGSCDRCRGATLRDLVTAGPGRRRVLDADSIEIPNPELFVRLRSLRKKLADADAIPAYVVFSDAVLRQMAEKVPRSEAELLALSGVGPAKLERWGAQFLSAIRDEKPATHP